jgi:hypothetical protein
MRSDDVDIGLPLGLPLGVCGEGPTIDKTFSVVRQKFTSVATTSPRNNKARRLFLTSGLPINHAMKKYSKKKRGKRTKKIWRNKMAKL